MSGQTFLDTYPLVVCIPLGLQKSAFHESILKLSFMEAQNKVSHLTRFQDNFSSNYYKLEALNKTGAHLKKAEAFLRENYKIFQSRTIKLKTSILRHGH